MYIDRAIHPVQSVSLPNDLTQRSQNNNTFHDILRRQLNNKSNSRPPKAELKGTLVPCSAKVFGGLFKFKLEAGSKEYFLRMSAVTALIAKKLEWDEVVVTGYVNVDSGVVDVEKINLVQVNEHFKAPTYAGSSYFDPEDYIRVIALKGKVELASDYLAS